MRDWTCPKCGRPTTITSNDESIKKVDLSCSRSDTNEAFIVTSHFIRCTNPKCNSLNLSVKAEYGQFDKEDYQRRLSSTNTPAGIGSFTFCPQTALPLSTFVPGAVLEDYNEAWLIKELSPKAAATLARRALQGMIRDYWGIVKSTLNDEINALEEKIDDDFFRAIKAVKGVGNIGAHPSKDVNLIVEIESGEAESLLDLIHILDREWYVARAGKAARLQRITQIGEEKDAIKAALKSRS